MQFLNIIVTGTGNSGKTTFIETLSEIPIINFGDIFIAKDPRQKVEFGRVQVSKDTFLYLIGTPPDERFHVFWDRASNDLIGFIFVISDKKSSIEETKKAIAILEEVENVPFVVVANGISNEQAVIDNLRYLLELKEGRDLIAVDVRKKEEAKKAVSMLLVISAGRDQKKTA